MLGFNEETNEHRRREELDLIDEKRDQALYNMTKYKHKVARFYNRRVKNRQFQVGDLVLRLLKSSKPTAHTKLGPKWEGPYRVAGIVGPGTYRLEYLDGRPIPHVWHAINLRKYYV